VNLGATADRGWQSAVSLRISPKEQSRAYVRVSGIQNVGWETELLENTTWLLEHQVDLRVLQKFVDEQLLRMYNNSGVSQQLKTD
jgi:hypothetical protein